MLTKEQVYDSLPEEVKPAILALAVLTNRIAHLPKNDQDELFDLLQDLRSAKDEEDRRSIIRAMEEIIAQMPVTARQLDETGTALLEGRRQRWAAHVGQRIRELREEAGWTQVQLSEKSGIPQSHISRLENAEYSPTRLTLQKLAAALGVPIDQLDPCAEGDKKGDRRAY